MSTTWVFLGLLGGRELAMSLRQVTDRRPGEAVRLLVRDVSYALVGLGVSILLAAAVNDTFRKGIARYLGL